MKQSKLFKTNRHLVILSVLTLMVLAFRHIMATDCSDLPFGSVGVNIRILDGMSAFGNPCYGGSSDVIVTNTSWIGSCGTEITGTAFVAGNRLFYDTDDSSNCIIGGTIIKGTFNIEPGETDCDVKITQIDCVNYKFCISNPKKTGWVTIKATTTIDCLERIGYRQFLCRPNLAYDTNQRHHYG